MKLDCAIQRTVNKTHDTADFRLKEGVRKPQGSTKTIIESRSSQPDQAREGHSSKGQAGGRLVACTVSGCTNQTARCNDIPCLTQNAVGTHCASPLKPKRCAFSLLCHLYQGLQIRPMRAEPILAESTCHLQNIPVAERVRGQEQTRKPDQHLAKIFEALE